MQNLKVLTGAVIGLLALAGCNNSADTTDGANASAEPANQAAREAAREMHNEMSANAAGEDEHSGMQDMHDMDNMQADPNGSMPGNAMNSSMPMENESGHM